MKTRTKFILWTLPILLIVLTYLYIIIVSNGLNVPWKIVGKPSENISKIIGYNLGVDKLYVYSVSGEMYSLPYYRYGDPIPLPSNWVKDKNYKKELDPIFENGYIPISFLSLPPPFKVKQIYQFEFRQIEGGSVTKFALSEDGNLWCWSVAGSGLQYFFYFLILAIEILAYIFALFVYFIIFLTKRAIRKFNFKTPNTQ